MSSRPRSRPFLYEDPVEDSLPEVEGPPAIWIRDLRHRYGRHEALRGVDLDVPVGSLYALLGPNGAGKTTLLKILLGLLRPTGGEAEINGTPVQKLRARHRQEIGYVAEGQDLPEWMTVRQLERFLSPLYPSWDPELADELRDRFRLPVDRKIRTFSRGQKMKTALLSVLAARPRVLILDEPFTGMDALVKDELIAGLIELATASDWTVLLCSHEIGELERLADWVGFLDRGRLILSEPLEVLQGRFRKVHVTLGPGLLAEPDKLPPTWLGVRRAGNRISFVTCEHGMEGWERELRAFVPGVGRVEVEPASLREVFVALAAEGMGGRDWDEQGGLR
ncbi:MAG: ABC transporter ATP-binding protein [Acidobacteria bacterium]|nr:ABC transporter ATP-binding protein [Acidobacteriota bacterium]